MNSKGANEKAVSRAEEAQPDSEELFLATFENVAVGIGHNKLDGSFLRVNQRLCQLTGYTREELLKRTPRDITHPDDFETELNLSNQVRAGEVNNYSMEKRCFRKDGSIFWVKLTVSLARNAAGRPNYFIGIVEDINERKQAAAEVKNRLAAIVESSADAIISKDLSGGVMTWNKGAEQLFGYTAEEMVGKSITILIPPDRLYEEEQVLENIRRGKKIAPYETIRQRKDGSLVEVSLSISPIKNKAGEIIGASKNVRDITERKQVESNLRESKERLAGIVSLAMDAIITIDEDQRIVLFNEAAERMFGCPAAEALGQPINRFIPERFRSAHTVHVRRFGETGGTSQAMGRLTALAALRADGTEFPIEASISSIEVGGQRLYTVILRDITERKQAEAILRESKERLAGIVSLAMDAIITIDEDQRIVLFNEAAERIFGCPAAEALGQPINRFIPERFRSAHTVHVRRFGETGGTSQAMGRLTALAALRADGTEFPIEASISSIEVGGQRLYTVILRDITERKQAEAEHELLAREQTARAETEHAAERIRRLQAVSDSALLHLTLDDLLHEMMARVQELLDTDAGAILLSTEDGQSLVVRATIGLEEDVRGLRVPLGKGVAGSIAVSRAPLVVENLSEWEVINPVLRRTAHSLVGVPLIVEGRLIGVIHADTVRARRFTEDDVRLLQLAADRVALAIEQARLYEVEQEARRQAEVATRAKDEFLAVVSHELRSPLTAILGWNRLLRSQRGDDPQIAKVTETVERSGKAQLKLIEDLLDTARIISGKMKLEFQPVDPVSIISAVIDTMRPAADSKGITVTTDLDPKVGQITGDPERLQQVIWNLVTNAIKFTPRGGCVRVELRRSSTSAQIVVHDTGKGISPDLLPYVFDRFKQGDSENSRRMGGLGLGLALVKHLVELHGGSVAVESPGEGLGATFTIDLPVRAVKGDSGTEGQIEGETSVYRHAGDRERTAKIEGVRALVVDDELGARELLAATLKLYGVLVTAADSTVTAMAALESRFGNEASEPFDILISDIGMPGASGYELIKRVRAHANGRLRHIQAIALTAYARTEDRLRALRAGFQLHVPKPVDEEELTTVIAALTDRL